MLAMAVRPAHTMSDGDTIFALATGALDGPVDLTRVLAGPDCTLLLADLGAEVGKVERPDTGDDARGFGPFLENGQSAYFASINRGKKSIALDLKLDSDRETFLRLVDRADVLVENYRAGTMHKLGLGAEALCRQNPRLVYASLSGFGHSGTDTDRAAYDVVVQALSGLMSITGSGPGQPVRVGTSISDILTGVFGAVAILAAVRGRDQTGKGTFIDLAMLDCTVAALENAGSRFATSGVSPLPLGTRHPGQHLGAPLISRKKPSHTGLLPGFFVFPISSTCGINQF